MSLTECQKANLDMILEEVCESFPAAETMTPGKRLPNAYWERPRLY